MTLLIASCHHQPAATLPPARSWNVTAAGGLQHLHPPRRRARRAEASAQRSRVLRAPGAHTVRWDAVIAGHRPADARASQAHRSTAPTEAAVLGAAGSGVRVRRGVPHRR
ncbi:hypothetical protein SEVIR_2G377101v4 [Setaria viridis]